ncbi:hypothetical protein ACIREE_41100 [Streptomyces sp. NPDC102467]|uniref:hypothetical protein n=1 Tax=Streptomyces sp. NPDC102467 TaxID=3366179 RepID=UPI003800BD4E
MKITIEGASEEFERKLLALLAEHRDELAVTADTAWNIERAMKFLRDLNASARMFVRFVVNAGGRLDAAVLREEFDRGLRGPTVALTYALKRGVKHGWWPEGTEAPVTVVYGGPSSPAWRQADSYELTPENCQIFREAFALLDVAPVTWDADAPHPLGPLTGWGDDDDVPRALVDEPPAADLDSAGGEGR